MNRRRIFRALAIVAVVGTAAIAAFGVPPFGRARGWRVVPRITVVSRGDDPRRAVVREAVEFWNRTLASERTPFRLGAITEVPGIVSDTDLVGLSDGTLRGAWIRQHPSGFARFPGDLLVVLSDADFISFSSRLGDRRLVAIKNPQRFPLPLPNVLRNVIAHELGHAIGLDHNDDPATLMCGRPAPCRPQLFASDVPRFFPLTDSERARLRALYPPTWTPQR